MPRPERSIDVSDGPIAEFALALRALRRDAALTYRELAARTDYSYTVLAHAAAGRDLPSWPVTRAYIAACGGNLTEWEQRWRDLAQQLPTGAADPSEQLREVAGPTLPVAAVA